MGTHIYDQEDLTIKQSLQHFIEHLGFRYRLVLLAEAVSSYIKRILKKLVAEHVGCPVIVPKTKAKLTRHGLVLSPSLAARLAVLEAAADTQDVTAHLLELFAEQFLASNMQCATVHREFDAISFRQGAANALVQVLAYENTLPQPAQMLQPSTPDQQAP